MGGESLLSAGWRRFGSQIVAGLAISAMILVPCCWHRRIEAGDLPSHVYNAWLAQLIEKGQAPGLYIAKQWNNILFDVALLRAADLFGLAITWRARGFEWIAVISLALLALLAHPIGFLWLVGTTAHIRVREKLPGWWKLATPLAAATIFAAICWYASRRPSLFADWDR